MSRSESPTMIVAARRGERVAMRAHGVARVFRWSNSTEYYGTQVSAGALAENGSSPITRRTLTRTQRLIGQMKEWGALPAAAGLGSSVLRDKKSGVFFPEIAWESKRGATVRHWLRLCKPMKAVDRPPSAIRLVTGTCLFGGSAMVHFADGSQRPLVSTRQLFPSRIVDLTISEDLSLYELDTACRLGGLIGDMIGGYGSATKVYLHIPRPEYVLVMMGHQRGGGGDDVMKDWLTAVDQRSARVGRLFKAILGVQKVHASVGSPLDKIIMPYLRDAVMAGETPTPAELADIIRNTRSSVGNLFKHWLGSRKNESDVDYYDLAQFSYVAGVMLNMSSNALTIEVDNPSEEPIFKAVSRVTRQAGRLGAPWDGNAMAIYPYEQMANWHEGSTDWRRVTGTAIEGDIVGAMLAQYGLDAYRRDQLLEVVDELVAGAA